MSGAVRTRELLSYAEKTEFLRQYALLDCRIDSLIAERKHWTDRALSICTSTAGGVRGYHETDTVQHTLERAEQLEEIINREIDRLYSLREFIVSSIAAFDNDILRSIIYLKYIRNQSLEQIAEQLGYCCRQIGRLHRLAIEQLCLVTAYPDNTL